MLFIYHEMSNTEILRLVASSELFEEDRIEILRIFEIMTDDRKLQIIEDFPRISAQIKAHREQIEEEKKLLLEQAIARIEQDLEAYNRSLVGHSTENELEHLKTQI